MLIYGSTSLENEQRGIDESVWISSGIVKREKLEQFIKALNIYSEGRQELFDVTGFSCSSGWWILLYATGSLHSSKR